MFRSIINSAAMRLMKQTLTLQISTCLNRLLEVLELPQLAETCVRNGHYEEALELKQYVTRLNKKLGSIPIVSEVVQVQNELFHYSNRDHCTSKLFLYRTNDPGLINLF